MRLLTACMDWWLWQRVTGWRWLDLWLTPLALRDERVEHRIERLQAKGCYVTSSAANGENGGPDRCRVRCVRATQAMARSPFTHA